MATIIALARNLGCKVIHTRESYKPDLTDVHAYRRSLNYVGEPGPLAKLLRYGMRRRGITHKVVGITILATTGIMTWLSIVYFFFAGTLKVLVFGVVMMWVAWRFLEWFGRYAIGPMVPVPILMQQGLYNDLLLEWREDNSDETSKPTREDIRLYLSRYSGNCSVCGGVVRACDGGREFPRRIIGICELSPSEHIFSFDPKTRHGLPLREWAIQR